MNPSKLLLLAGLLSLTADLSGRTIPTGNSAMRHVVGQNAQPGLRFGGNNRQNKAHKATDIQPVGQITDAYEYGILMAETGTTWHYTVAPKANPADPYMYAGADIQLYNDYSELVTTIHYEVPSGMRVNAIEPFGHLSSKFFDRNANTLEFLVYVHEIGPSYTSVGHFLVYNTLGELVQQYDNLSNILWFDATEKWDTYQRAIFVKDSSDAEGQPTTVMSIMKPGGWSSEEPVLEHEFEVRNSLMDYSDGPCLNTYKIDGKPYYALSHYEMPFAKGYDSNFDILLQEDNHYMIELYDQKFNQVCTLSVPADHPDGVFCSMYSLGMFSYEDVQKGFFSGDDKMNFIVTRQDVRLDSEDDTYPYTFLVYDQDNNYLNTISSNVITWKQLTDIRGEERQIGFLCQNDVEQTLEMVNLPSCEKVMTLPSIIDDYRISFNFDRYPAKGSYQYAIGIGEAEVDDRQNVIALIGWVDRSGNVDHYVEFNLGRNGEFFTPLIESYSLNPALFNTDSQHEYVYIAKIGRSGSTIIDNVLVVADEKGYEIARFSSDDTKTLRVASVVDTETKYPRLVVGYSNNQTGKFDIDFYDLPFSKFEAGGSGKSSDPYIITSAGDMKMMARKPSAHYALGSDIDMAEIAEPWRPIEGFEGKLEGNGHSIKNLWISGNDLYAGLFSDVSEGCVVRNLNFEDPSIDVNSNNYYVGLLSGFSLKGEIENVHVRNLRMQQTEEAQAMVGGLIGQATSFTTVNTSSIVGAIIDLPTCTSVGGMAGDTRTSTHINACLYQGEIYAQSSLGGIVGSSGMSSDITNCHVIADLNGQRLVGGLVGDASRSTYANNYIEGTLTANGNGKVCAGGLLGRLESDWQRKDTVLVKGNIVDLEAFEVSEEAQAHHRIVGFSVADEDYEPGETVLTDKSLSNNIANAILPAQNAGANQADGDTFESLDPDLLSSLGFAMGEDAQSPWMFGTALTLFFEENQTGIGTVAEGSTETGSLRGFYNLSGQPIEQQHGLIVGNGKIRFIR